MFPRKVYFKRASLQRHHAHVRTQLNALQCVQRHIAHDRDWLYDCYHRAEQIPGPSEYQIDLCPMTPFTSRKWVGELLMEKRQHFNNRAKLRKERNKRFISPLKKKTRKKKY